MIADEEQPIDYWGRVVIDPGILVGKPVVKGTRIPVSLILNLVAHGASFAEIIEDYPILTVADIQAAILYAGACLEQVKEMPSKRRQRRLEEHHMRVAQARARLGDPDESLERFMTESFDADVLRRIAREFAADDRDGAAIVNEDELREPNER